MSKIICRICLRTDLETRAIKETLIDFHDEITENDITENSALKYCSICEHLLIKFYNFSRKCIKANKILKSFKKEKNKGFPSHLHELLLPKYSLSRSTLQQFHLNNGNLELIKHENKTDELENYEDDDKEDINTVPTNGDQENDIKIDEPGNRCSVEINNTSDKLDDKPLIEMAVKDLGDEVKLEDDSNEQENDIIKDSSDTDMINTFVKQVSGISQKSKKGAQVSKKQQRPRKPMKNHTKYENVFDIQVFASYEEAKAELQLRVNSEPYLSAAHKCEVCYTVYKCAKILKFHMRWHELSAGDHECDICFMRFENRLALTRHKNHSHWGKFTCKNCPMMTYIKGPMLKHYQTHVGLTFPCKICDQSFKSMCAYNTHQRVSHKSNYVCVICARTFVTEKGLDAHKIYAHKTKSKVSSDDPSAHCAPCGLTFANEQVYTVHIMRTDIHKDLAKTIIACRACGERFEDNNDLKVHRRTHNLNYKSKSIILLKTKLSDKDPYRCPICGVVGTSHLWVCRHVISVHPDAPYVEDLKKRRQHMCDTCGKCYTNIHTLREHMFRHSGARLFACASCPARFQSRLRLAIHLERHQPPRRECARCGKKFSSAANLYCHMRMHIQDRRYKCHVCDKGFLHASALKEHVRGVHNNVRRARKRAEREAVTHESP